MTGEGTGRVGGRMIVVMETLPRPLASESAASPAGGVGVRDRDRARRRRREGLGPWLALGALLLLALLPLGMERLRGLPVRADEAAHLREAMGVYRSMSGSGRGAGVDGADAAASDWTGVLPRISEVAAVGEVEQGDDAALSATPGLAWLQAVVMGGAAGEARGGDFDNANVARARLLSAGAVLLAVAGVFWCGFAIGGVRTATLSAAVLAGHPLALGLGALATPGAVLLAAGSVAAGSAAWAIRPLRPPPSLVRQGLGWAVCGLAVGVAALCGGLVVVPAVLLPIIMFLALCPNRVSHTMGLGAAVALAGLMFLPWVVAVHATGGGSSGWLVPGAVDFSLRGYGMRAMTVGLLVLPWAWWVVAGLVQPWLSSTGPARVRMMLGWSWLVGVAAVLLAVPLLGPRPLVAVMLPGLAVLVGQLFRQLADLSEEGRHAAAWRVLKWVSVGCIVAGTLVLPVMGWAASAEGTGGGVGEAGAGEGGPWPVRLLAPQPWVYWAAWCVALAVPASLSVRHAVRNFPARAALAWSAWWAVAVAAVVGAMA